MNLQPQNTATPSPSSYCSQVSSGCLFLVSPPPRQPVRCKESQVPGAALHWVVSLNLLVTIWGGGGIEYEAGEQHFVLQSVTPGLAYTVLGFVWFPGAHVTSGGVSGRPCITGQRWAPASQSTNLPARVTSPLKKAQAPKIVQLIIKRLRWICAQVQKSHYQFKWGF